MPTAFVPTEIREGETRVAATPDTVKRLIKAGLSVTVESGAGRGAAYDDAAYQSAGAHIEPDVAKGMSEADLVLMVSVPTVEQIDSMRDGAAFIGFLWPYEHPEIVRRLVAKQISAFAMDAIPRISRAQKHDARSSQSNLAGYKAVLLAAARLPKIFPLLMTAAGTIRPAKVVVVGAGVAGLQAVATARRLGAIVEVSDVRPEVKEQAQSLGAAYIEVASQEDLSGADGYAREQSDAFKRRQQETLHTHVAAADVVITTALIPYRPAPKIITEAMVRDMSHGSVIVDIAAERGGNCELTVPGETVVRHGVTLMGPINLEATLPVHCSDVYARNIHNVVADVLKEGALVWNPSDEVVDGALITHDGEIRHDTIREAVQGPAPEATPEPSTPEEDA